MTEENAADTHALQLQALRHQVDDLRRELSETRLQLRLRTDQCTRRQQTIDALRTALTERMSNG